MPSTATARIRRPEPSPPVAITRADTIRRQGPPAVSLADKLLLSDVECALLLGSSRSKVREWLQDGSLPSLKLDGLRKVRRADLIAFTERLAAGRITDEPPAPTTTEPIHEAAS